LHIQFLEEALKHAHVAADKGEVPVGAVIVCNNEIIASGYNLKETLNDCTAHAELLAIKQAQSVLGNWRLTRCILYSTLEPCPMCMGAILHARIDKVVFGAKDLKWGACGTQIELSCPGRFNHYVESVFIETPECSDILTNFFRMRRDRGSRGIIPLGGVRI
jgi:tRNA(adenine34) deaminase